MSAQMLKRALDDCAINFDRRVLVTDLLQEYHLEYKEVNEIVGAYVADQEKDGTKFEKSFLVSGDDKDSSAEVYTVVKGESKLQEWLRKLENAEAMLYSVEVAGGAKAVADEFKPMTWCSNQREASGTRPALKWGSVANGSSNGDTKPQPKVEEKKKGFDFGVKKLSADLRRAVKDDTVEEEPTKSTPDTKKEIPKSKQIKDITPEEKKPATTKANNKKGIAGFFGPQTSNVKAEAKKATGVVKPPSPKKLQDFFKKSANSAPSTSKANKEEKAANTSVQLFGNDEEDDDESMKEDSHTVVEVDTSNDEAELELIRRQCNEKEESEPHASNAGGRKRRRIIDSDDDDNDEPEVKHEKKEGSETKNKVDNEDNEEAGKSETFLDEDGFVITIKSKKSAAVKKPVKPKTPEKSSPKEETSKKPTAQAKQTPKTKQGNIMSFFSKK